MEAVYVCVCESVCHNDAAVTETVALQATEPSPITKGPRYVQNPPLSPLPSPTPPHPLQEALSVVCLFIHVFNLLINATVHQPRCPVQNKACCIVQKENKENNHLKRLLNGS